MSLVRHTNRLDELLGRLGTCLATDASRAEAAAASRSDAMRLAPQLPWIHRTGHAGSPGWRAIFQRRRLAAGAMEPDSLEREIGWDKVVFCFVAAPAYPKGGVALIVHGLDRTDTTFAPFDTGAVAQGGHLIPCDGRPWDRPDRVATLRSHIGVAENLDPFVGELIATHLRDPMDYVRRQQKSLPDFPTFHGLISPCGDRRAWTVEVQVHADVPLHPDQVKCIVIDQNFEDLEIPDGLLDRVALYDPQVDLSFDAFVVRQALAVIDSLSGDTE